MKKSVIFIFTIITLVLIASSCVRVNPLEHTNPFDPKSPNYTPPNSVPTANAGTDITVSDSDDSGSESITLDGSGADSDGTIASYSWSTNGVEIATGTNTNVSMPVGSHTVTLTVTDNDGATGTDTVLVTINAYDNLVPTANAGTDITVSDSDDSGFESVALDGSGSADSDGTIASYLWSANGIDFATGTNTNVLMPVGGHTVTLTVTDDDGDTGTDTVLVTVNAYDNLVPTANAGSDITVSDSDDSGSESITLDGSGSADSDGTISSYSWSTNGVEIATGSSPTVSMPVGTHTVTLTVTDDDGDTGTDTVTVTVNAYVNQAPTANAGTDITITDIDGNGNESVTLDGSGSADSDGTIASYSWSTNGIEFVTGVSPSVTLPLGTYTVTLTVTDDDGDTGADTMSISVIEGTVPVAAYTVSATNGTTNTVFSFDASGSSDVEDDISELEVRWDFDGDGNWDTDWVNEKTTNHTYPNAWFFTPVLEVKDRDTMVDSVQGEEIRTVPEQYGDGRDGNIIIYSGTINIDDLYNNDDVSGVITHRGTDKGLNYGANAYDPQNGAYIQASNFVIESDAGLTHSTAYGDGSDIRNGIIWIACLDTFDNQGTVSANLLGYSGGARGYNTWNQPGAGGKGGLGPGGGSDGYNGDPCDFGDSVGYGGSGGTGGTTTYGSSDINTSVWDYLFGSGAGGGGGGSGHTGYTGGNPGQAGGGAIRLYALIFTNAGSISADGGNGGNAQWTSGRDTTHGGGGGGGAASFITSGGKVRTEDILYKIDRRHRLHLKYTIRHNIRGVMICPGRRLIRWTKESNLYYEY